MPKEDTTFYVVQTLDWFSRKDFTNPRAPSQNYVKRSFMDSKEATNNVVSGSVIFPKGIWKMVWYKAYVLAAIKSKEVFLATFGVSTYTTINALGRPWHKVNFFYARPIISIQSS